MVQAQQTKTDFFCEFNKGCASMCSLCPHRGSGRKEAVLFFTQGEILALLRAKFVYLATDSRKNTNSALQKLEQAYKENCIS